MFINIFVVFVSNRNRAAPQWGSMPKSVGSVENVDIDVTGDKFDAGQRESADRR